MAKLLEQDIKSLTITKLIQRGLLSRDSLLMSELTVGKFERRVDLAFTSKERLVGVEIKSEADSLKRLDGQLQTYSEYFDKVILVVAPKFISTLKRSIPNWFGLWEVSNEGFYMHRKGRFKNQITKTNLIDFLDVVDLKKLANKYQLKCDNDRVSLEDKLSNVARSELRRAVIESLERKFRDGTERFFEGINEKQTKKEDLKLLSRFVVQKEIALEKRKSNQDFWTNLDCYLESLRKYTEKELV